MEQVRFPFPYDTPYRQQTELMFSIFETIETSSIGIFESPTGTGKTLSLICSALYWQEKEESRLLKECNPGSQPATSQNDWLAEMLAESDQHSGVAPILVAKKFNEFKRKIGSYSTKFVRRDPVPTQQLPQDEFEDLDSEFALPNYDSDDLETSKTTIDDEDDEFDFSELNLPKIFYCSRTHSQLSQFIEELRKTSYSNTRCITLGSRRHMCINLNINSLKSDSMISHKCMEMQKAKAKPQVLVIEGKRKRARAAGPIAQCEYHCARKESRFVDHSLGRVRDIEELVQLGRDLHCCPYYGSRKSLQAAQVVCLPYSMMLQKEQRKALGIDLKNNVVIFDEAHNVIEAINSSHSAELCFTQLMKATQSVDLYMARFLSALSGRNLYYLRVLQSVLQTFSMHLSRYHAAAPQTDSHPQNGQTKVVTDNSTILGPPYLLSVNDFVFEFQLDNINLLKLCKHATTCQLVQKIGSYSDRMMNSHSSARGAGLSDRGETANGVENRHADGEMHFALRSLFNLLKCLCNRESDGRLFIGPTGDSSQFNSNRDPLRSRSSVTPECSPNPAITQWSIRFVLMNAASSFKEIVDSARSVILIGGTLQPFRNIVSSLLPDRIQNSAANQHRRLNTFACGHIVPPSHVCAYALRYGMSGRRFNFRHANRYSEDVIAELHGIICALCRCVPFGVVVFFPSYSYLEHVISRWTAHERNLFSKLADIKPVFVERRGERRGPDSRDALWSAYCTAARASERGATLLSVVGGSLSEGINFSDELARCVVVIGLPYPDVKDPVLREKIAFADSHRAGSGRSLYEAMCITAINQSIGRSIRHAKDYAAIVLLDERYGEEKIIRQLPVWISSRLCISDKPADVVPTMVDFFRTMKDRAVS